jgi:hypothetical protein
MRISISILMCAAAASFGCSHEQPPQTPHNAARSEAQPPMAIAIDPLAPTTKPLVAEPKPVVGPDAVAPNEPSLTPASGVGGPRTSSAQFVPGDAAMNQADTPEDRESIREIRAALAADKSLSEAAKGVSVIVRRGRVWLRGQVTTAEERAAVERAARQAVGVLDVRNDVAVME